MKLYVKLLCLTISAFTLTQCRFISNEIKDSFNTVNHSIERSNAVLRDSLHRLYISIDSNRQDNPALKLKADGVFYSASRAFKYLDSLTRKMAILDSSGENITLPTAMFINTPTGDTLKNILLQVFDCSRSTLTDTSRIHALDRIFDYTTLMKSGQNWESIYFHNTPTAAAITILNKFRNDCENAAIISFTDINDRMKLK